MSAETLSQKRFKFPLMVAKLIEKAHEMGFEVTFGDAYRDPRMHGEFGEKKGYGAPKSCHKLRLAIDLNLYKDGMYLETTADHKPLGEWWESQGGTWGGRFNDGNHYSLSHDGAK